MTHRSSIYAVAIVVSGFLASLSGAQTIDATSDDDLKKLPSPDPQVSSTLRQTEKNLTLQKFRSARERQVRNRGSLQGRPVTPRHLTRIK